MGVQEPLCFLIAIQTHSLTLDLGRSDQKDALVLLVEKSRKVIAASIVAEWR